MKSRQQGAEEGAFQGHCPHSARVVVALRGATLGLPLLLPCALCVLLRRFLVSATAP